MALDLKIIVPIYPQNDCMQHLLSFWNQENVFEKILEKEQSHGIEVNEKGVYSCCADKITESGFGFGSTTKTAYGYTLKYLKNKHLIEVLKKTELNRFNEGILLFLEKQPLDLPIYLYWC